MITRDEFEAVRARLCALEAECGSARRAARRWRAVAVVGLLVLAAVALSAAPREAAAQNDAGTTVEAQRFVLKDAKGRARARLFADEAGSYFQLLREDGKLAVQLGAMNEDTYLLLHDVKGGQRAILSVRGEKGLPRLILQESEKTSAVLVGWSARTGDGPMVSLYDEGAKRRGAFGIVKPEPTSLKPVPCLVLIDDAGKATVTKP